MRSTFILPMILIAGAAMGHTGATGVVKERMDAMGSMADQMEVIVPMMRGTVAYDGAVMAEHAGRIAVLASGGAALFPVGSLQSPTEAAPAIWENFGKFEDMFLELETTAVALEAAALRAEAPPTAAFTAMVRTCSGCHERFRIETD